MREKKSKVPPVKIKHHLTEKGLRKLYFNTDINYTGKLFYPFYFTKDLHKYS